MTKKLIILTLILFSIYQSKSQKRIDDISELLINTTIKVSSTEESTVLGVKHKFSSSGTGFFFNFKLNDSIYIPVIVTNRHVIANSIDGFLTFNIVDSNSMPTYGKKQLVYLKNFKSYWMIHPDSTVDLAIMPIQPLLDDYKKRGISLSFLPLDEQLIPNDSTKKTLAAIENVYMIGYPFGRRDEFNNLPIVRRGITATPSFLDYEGRKEFLADLPVYFGSSGSPIVIYENGFSTKQGGFVSGQRVIFLGINYATYLKNYEGKILPKFSYDISTDSTKTEISIPYNLGIIIKSERLLEFKPILEKLVGLPSRKKIK